MIKVAVQDYITNVPLPTENNSRESSVYTSCRSKVWRGQKTKKAWHKPLAQLDWIDKKLKKFHTPEAHKVYHKGSLMHVAPSYTGSNHFGSYVRSLSLHFFKRLFPGLEPMTSWSQGNNFTAVPGLPFP
jgi:hypothetical protein